MSRASKPQKPRYVHLREQDWKNRMFKNANAQGDVNYRGGYDPKYAKYAANRLSIELGNIAYIEANKISIESPSSFYEAFNGIGQVEDRTSTLLTFFDYLVSEGLPIPIDICSEMGSRNVEVLKWARAKGASWNESTCEMAAKWKNLESLKWAHENGCPWNEDTCLKAVEPLNRSKEIEWCVRSKGEDSYLKKLLSSTGGDVALSILQYAHKNGCPWNENVSSRIASWGTGSSDQFEPHSYYGSRDGLLHYADYDGMYHEMNENIDYSQSGTFNGEGKVSALKWARVVLEWAHENGCPWNRTTCANLAGAGNLPTLQWARDQGCPWDSTTALNAGALYADRGRDIGDMLKWIYENGCPMTENKGTVFQFAQNLLEPECKPYTLDMNGCTKAAMEGKLLCLMRAYQWGRSMTEETLHNAAFYGHLDCLTFAHKNGCKWSVDTCMIIAQQGHLDCLRYAHENACPWDDRTCFAAALSGKLDCLMYAHENGCPWNEATCTSAAENDHLDCLRYAHENGCPWNRDTCKVAEANGHIWCLQYARDNGCCEIGTDDNSIRGVKTQMDQGVVLNSIDKGIGTDELASMDQGVGPDTLYQVDRGMGTDKVDSMDQGVGTEYVHRANKGVGTEYVHRANKGVGTDYVQRDNKGVGTEDLDMEQQLMFERAKTDINAAQELIADNRLEIHKKIPEIESLQEELLNVMQLRCDVQHALQNLLDGRTEWESKIIEEDEDPQLLREIRQEMSASISDTQDTLQRLDSVRIPELKHRQNHINAELKDLIDVDEYLQSRIQEALDRYHK